MPLYSAPATSAGLVTPDTFAWWQAAAGSDYLYSGTRGSSRIPSAWTVGKDAAGKSRSVSGLRPMVRDMMLDAQGGRCPICAGPVVRGEFNHVSSQGPAERGWGAGNVFVGCKAENAATAPEWSATGELVAGIATLPWDYFAAPEVIPAEWTPFSILIRS